MRETWWRRVRRFVRPDVVGLVIILVGLAGGALVAQRVYGRIAGYAGFNPTVIKVRKHLLNLADRPLLALERHTSTHRDPGRRSPLPQLHLSIKPKQLEKLLAALPSHPNTKLPEGARAEVKARIVPVGFAGIPEEPVKVAVRFRGNGSSHWFWPKKSWRVKFPKDQLFRGVRRLNIINPESLSMLNDAIAVWLAQRIGLVTPPVEPVKLYVNGSYHGLMLMAEQPDEYFLQRHDQAVGNVYAETDELNDELWTSIHAWRKLAVGKGSTESDFSDLHRLLALTNHPDDAVFDAHIEELLDVEAFLRWHAIGEFFQSYHQDHLHNNRMVVDPTDGRFRFVVWDLQAFHPYDLAPQVTHPLVLRVLGNPAFRGRYEEILAELAFDGALEREAKQELERLIELTREDALADARKAFAFSAFERVPFSNARYEEAVAALRERLARRFQELRDRFAVARGIHATALLGADPSLPTVLELELPADWSVVLEQVRLAGQASSEPGRELIWDRNRDGRLDATDPVIAAVDPAAATVDDRGDGALCFDAGQLLAPWSERVAGLRRRERFFAPGLEASAADVTVTAARRIGGRRIAIDVVTKLAEPTPFAVVAAPAVASGSLESDPVGDPSGLGGTRGSDRHESWGPDPVVIAGVRRIERGTVVTVQPGTRIELEAGAALHVQGRLIAEGTATAPIRFVGRAGARWGVIAVVGAGANGSRFAHAEFDGGSERRIDGIGFTGMLAIHHADVPVRDCVFRGAAGDDALNCKYWDSVIERCRFEDNGFDAIDMDFSAGTIRATVVLRSGNDGIDLGTADTRLVDIEIRDCGDKGISMGERSEPEIVNCLVVGNQIGLATKDLSHPRLVHCTIVGNRTGIAAYRKKQQFGGGSGELTNCILLGNDDALYLDELSEVDIRHSCVDDAGADPTGGRRGNVLGSIDALEGLGYFVSPEASPAILAGGDPGATRRFLRWGAATVPMGRLAPETIATAAGAAPTEARDGDRPDDRSREDDREEPR